MGKLNYSGKTIAHEDFSDSEMQEANFVDAKIFASEFDRSDLSRSNLRGASFVNCSFRHANLEGADCQSARFSRSIMHSANFTNANLSSANLTNVHFADHAGEQQACLAYADLRGAIFTTKSNSRADGSFIDLGMCEGLTTAIFSSPQFLTKYIQEAFEFSHHLAFDEKEKYPSLVSAAIHKLRYLVPLLETEDPPQELEYAINVISTELVCYLKKKPKELHNIRPRQFEELVAEILASFGWDVQLTPAQKDGGYDIFAITKDIAGVKSSWIIECKKNRLDRKVGVEVARSLHAVKHDLRISNSLLVTTSSFTRGVRAYKASRYDMQLVDYAGIVDWINEYRPNPNGKLYVKDNALILPDGKDYHNINP